MDGSKNVLNKINEGYIVLYYGKHNHPEAKAVLNDNQNVYLVSNEQDVNRLDIDINSKIFFTNQTTMSYFDTLKIMHVVKNKFNNVDVNIDICNASRMRQIAVYNKARECDVVIVVGDKKSNNTAKLRDICNDFNIKNYLIENIEDLTNMIGLGMVRFVNVCDDCDIIDIPLRNLYLLYQKGNTLGEVSNKMVSFDAFLHEFEEFIELYDRFCTKRGFIMRGNEIDYTRAGKAFIDEFRAGKFGRVTLE